jgi:cytosine/adenosine deaminase-related metal-dependent hydrolase
LGHSSLILRPYGLVISGHLELGLELVLHEGVIQEIRPHTGIPEPYVVSPAFVNAHSHLEYRGLLGVIQEVEYWPWIREITRLKSLQSAEDVRRDCLLAAEENRHAGVGFVAEHSDRPYAGEAMQAAGLEGTIFQEIITFFERESREEKLQSVDQKAFLNEQAFGKPVLRALHAYYTVDRETLEEFGSSSQPVSIHVAETDDENLFTREGKGRIADFYASNGVPFEPLGLSAVEALGQLGLLRSGVQFVHCCALSEGDIDLLSRSRVTVAHCPRSNQRLKCPPAPIRELLDAGVAVGLGLDSAASSGPIDMFAEMRAALSVSLSRGRAVSPEEVWSMATTVGSVSLEPFGCPQGWDIEPGSFVPLIKIHVEDAFCVEDLIEAAQPEHVEWV